MFPKDDHISNTSISCALKNKTLSLPPPQKNNNVQTHQSFTFTSWTYFSPFKFEAPYLGSRWNLMGKVYPFPPTWTLKFLQIEVRTFGKGKVLFFCGARFLGVFGFPNEYEGCVKSKGPFKVPNVIKDGCFEVFSCQFFGRKIVQCTWLEPI